MEEEEDASKKVRDESWEGGQEEELVDGGEVGLRKDPRAFILHHRSSESPRAHDAEPGQSERPADLASSVNLLCLPAGSPRHRDTCVGDEVEEDFANIAPLQHLLESSLILDNIIMEAEDGNPSEYDRSDDKKDSLCGS